MTVIKLNEKGKEVKHLQKSVNETLDNAELDWLKIKVDGDAGPLTFGATGVAASWQGLSNEHLKEIGKGLVVDLVFGIVTRQEARSEEMKKRSEERRDDFAKVREEHKHPPKDKDGVSMWGDRKVAAWMVGAGVGPDGKQVNWLQKSVDHGWSGGLFSGWRSPEESERVCLKKCGSATCENCAGRSSNHSQVGPPNWGAIDVQDFERFGQIQKQIGSPLKNALPTDQPHYSFTGR